MEAVIRPARKSDVKNIAKLAGELIPLEDLTKRNTMLMQSIDDSKRDIYVAEIKSEIVGFVDLWTFPDFVHGANLTIIQNLVVSEAFRSRGIGDELVRMAVKRAKGRKALELHAWTEFTNKPAISLYAKHGLKKRALLLEKEFAE